MRFTRLHLAAAAFLLALGLSAISDHGLIAAQAATAAPTTCIAPDQAVAVDQKAMDAQEPINIKFTAEEHIRLTGDPAKTFGNLLTSIGAPPSILDVDTFVIVRFRNAESGEYSRQERVHGFVNGCETEAGLVSTAMLAQMLRGA